jgi:hypothetical protein
MIYERMVRLAQTMHLSCTDSNTISKWTETGFHMAYVTKEFHWVQPNDFLAYGTFGTNHAPILREIRMISKRTESSFHLKLVTQKCHWVRPKRFLSLWYD